MRTLNNFSQETDPRLPGGAGKGVCLYMSLAYLNHARSGSDFWEWFDDTAGEVQRIGNLTRSPDFYIKDIREYGFRVSDRVDSRTNNLAEPALRGATGPFRLAVMDNGPLGMAHAIACYMGLKIRILDVSGGGEMEFDSHAEALAWLKVHVLKPRVKGWAVGSMLSYADAFPKLTVYGLTAIT